jgi:hypothetical protein
MPFGAMQSNLSLTIHLPTLRSPPTALCMLEQFVELQPGDTVVQNGATSAVGQHVIQLCRARGLRTVNIIRDRWVGPAAGFLDRLALPQQSRRDSRRAM